MNAFPDGLTVQELIEARVAAHGDATAVICEHDDTLGTSSLTYVQLNERVNQLAHRLRAEGVRPGDIVAIAVERSFAMTIGVFGIMKAGAAYLPIAPDTPDERIAYMLADGGVRMLLVHGKTLGLGDHARCCINLDDADVYSGPTANPEKVNTSSDLAYVIYTSGSTGRPKGVMIEHRSLINRLQWMQQAYPIGPDDVLLQKTPVTFVVSGWVVFWWALEGAALCYLAPGAERNPLAILETIRKHHVTVVHFVPSMLSVSLDYLDGKSERVLSGLASLRRVFASGEALTPRHVEKFNAVVGRHSGAQLTNLYGPTEATVDVSFYDCPTQGEIGIVPIGRPIDNIRLYVIKDGAHAAAGEPGELCIAGVGLARGYLNNPALTAERFVDNPIKPGERIYRTGDLARWLPDGNIEYLGREDQQVKIRGVRIELGEIENTIREYAGVADCIAVVERHSETIALIVAYVVWGADAQVDGLRTHLKRHLPEYMLPHRFEQIDAIPTTPSGKADRKALRAPAPHLDATPPAASALQVGSA